MGVVPSGSGVRGRANWPGILKICQVSDITMDACVAYSKEGGELKSGHGLLTLKDDIIHDEWCGRSREVIQNGSCSLEVAGSYELEFESKSQLGVGFSRNWVNCSRKEVQLPRIPRREVQIVANRTSGCRLGGRGERYVCRVTLQRTGGETVEQGDKEARAMIRVSLLREKIVGSRSAGVEKNSREERRASERERGETRRKLQAGPLLAVQAEDQRDWVRGSRAVERACQVLRARYVTRPQKVGEEPGTPQVLDWRLRLFDAQISMAE